MSEDSTLVEAIELRRFVIESLTASSVPRDEASVAADVFYRASLRGVGHHDIADLPMRLAWLRDGKVRPGAQPTVEQSNGGVCRIDGANALGEICASRALDEAMTRASEFGIGLAVVRNSNHFLAAHPYVQRAVESGFIAMIMSRGAPAMGTPGAGRRVVGNNPFGFGAAVADSPPFLIDMCWAHLSQGSLRQLVETGEKVPDHWGTDSDGNPTGEPKAIHEGAPEPIGGHKGVSMSFVVEILTSVLGNGPVSDEKSTPDGHSVGMHVQTAIAIDVSSLNDATRATERTADLLARVEELDGREFRYAGERSAETAKRLVLDGVPIARPVLLELDEWADRLSIPPIQR